MNSINDEETLTLHSRGSSGVSVRFIKERMSSMRRTGRYLGTGLVEFDSEGVFFSAFQTYPFWTNWLHWLITQAIAFVVCVMMMLLGISIGPLLMIVLPIWIVRRLWLRPQHGFIPYEAILSIGTITKKRIIGIDYEDDEEFRPLVFKLLDYQGALDDLTSRRQRNVITSTRGVIRSLEGETYEAFRKRINPAWEPNKQDAVKLPPMVETSPSNQLGDNWKLFAGITFSMVCLVAAYLAFSGQLKGNAYLKQDSRPVSHFSENGERHDDIESLHVAQSRPAENVKHPYSESFVLASKGEAVAQTKVGIALMHGQGVTKNTEEAVQWLLKAADQREPEALYRLALHYYSGQHIGRDEVLALALFELAAEAGNKNAVLLKSDLSQLVTGHELIEAENLTDAARQTIPNQRPLSAIIRDRKKEFPSVSASSSHRPVIQKKPYQSTASIDFPKSQRKTGHSESCICSLCFPGNDWNAFNTDSSSIDEASKTAVVQKWTNTEGKTIEANFVGLANDKVELKDPKTEKIYVIPLARLSRESKGLAEHLHEKTTSASLKHLPTDVRPSTGVQLIDRLNGGNGELTVKNGLADDAFVKMIHNERLVMSFYVRGGQQHLLNDIPDGDYRLLYCTGFGWMRDQSDFSRGRRACQFDELLSFTTTLESKRILTVSISLTLHQVAHGNASTSDIRIDDFDKYQ